MRIDVDTTVANGEWDRTEKRVRVRDDCAVTPELVAHEWGHAIADGIGFEAKTSGFNLGDPLALSEGFADCFAMMVYDGNWQWMETPGTCPVATRDAMWARYGGYRRRLPSDDAHDNGQIVSHICYLASRLTHLPAGPFACTWPWDCPSFSP
jgi:hypothetical protein